MAPKKHRPDGFSDARPTRLPCQENRVTVGFERCCQPLRLECFPPAFRALEYDERIVQPTEYPGGRSLHA